LTVLKDLTATFKTVNQPSSLIFNKAYGNTKLLQELRSIDREKELKELI